MTDCSYKYAFDRLRLLLHVCAANEAGVIAVTTCGACIQAHERRTASHFFLPFLPPPPPPATCFKLLFFFV